MVKLLSPGFCVLEVMVSNPGCKACFTCAFFVRPVDYHLGYGMCALSKISWRGALLLCRERLNTYGKT